MKTFALTYFAPIGDILSRDATLSTLYYGLAKKSGQKSSGETVTLEDDGVHVVLSSGDRPLEVRLDRDTHSSTIYCIGKWTGRFPKEDGIGLQNLIDWMGQLGYAPLRE